ncbi:YbaB/EbfC family nucleoid-associated protein [Roseomonas marmotae]|uniref:Nucleoid-associated protein IAI60_10085 n=1 Tax=Roseomonas marmotae TaxID=2768161 RepID=A0ABS3KD79_9PROT|nr:YbaB/EbfC family nucleoid-associated protein [Roseomonas marmotae]MBO1074957.1 YbaB/EbfC family nucleoid-associated protein [Roseomonas marmotae]QTI80002.1 YbaB/EbfC family nucleoid-associated protein [Roseomonas marmotae]
MKNLAGMMKQAQQMQAKMQEMQARLEATLVEGSAGAGMVKLTLSGKGDMKKLTIDPSLVDAEEKEVLEDLIVAAHADARTKVEAMMAEEMQKATAGLNIPGMGGGLPGGFKLPF